LVKAGPEDGVGLPGKAGILKKKSDSSQVGRTNGSKKVSFSAANQISEQETILEDHSKLLKEEEDLFKVSRVTLRFRDPATQD